MTLVNQPTKAPSRKMLIGAVGGIITAALQQWALASSDSIPAFAFLGTAGIEELLPIFGMFAAGYLFRDRAST